MKYDKSKSNLGPDGWPIYVEFDNLEEADQFFNTKTKGYAFNDYLRGARFDPANPYVSNGPHGPKPINQVGFQPYATPAATPAATTKASTPSVTDADKEIESYGLDRLNAAEAGNADALEAWNSAYLDTKDQLEYIITSGLYPTASVAKAKTKLAAIEKTYKVGETLAYKAAGKTKGAKDVEQLGQLINYVRSKNPPSTEEVLQSNVDAMKGVLGEVVDLELQYGPQLAEVAGQAQREQMIKNIQAATDTPEISALRRKKSLTSAEKQTLAAYDAQFAKTPTAELAAKADTLFNQAIQSGKLEQYQKLMPQYKEQYLGQMPGATQTLQSLGQLGSEMAAQANTAPQLTAFEKQVGGPVYGEEIGKIAGPTAGQALSQVQGPTYGQELGQVAGPTSGGLLGAVEGPTYGQELNQVQGPIAGQYLSRIAGPTADMSLGGMQAYRPGEFTSNIAGPELQSALGNIDQRLVSQYMGTMPGVQEGAAMLAQQANADLAAGRSLTPEQERMATQAAREAYAARGMALGPQAIGAEILGREELANQRYLQRQASAQQALGTISNLYQPALAQTYARQVGAEQYGLGAQAQMFGQGMSIEDLQRTAQAQEYQQRLGLEQFGLGLQSQQYQQALGQEQLGLSSQAQQFGQASTREQQQAAIQAQRYGQALEGEKLGLATQAQTFGQASTKEQQQAAIQSQQYQQALGKEQLGLSTQAQQFSQAATKEQQQATIQEQQFNQALSRSEAELNRLQAANTLKANAAQIATGVLGTQQQALSPAMSAYFNVPPSQGAYPTSVNQATNQFEQAGLNIANPTNPVLTGLSMMPFQSDMSQYANQANFLASYLQGRASAPSGGKSGGCCFIMLEARYGNGVMDEVVRRYRDEHVTPRNQRGYYKLAEVFVPLMRKSKLFKFAVSKLFADPSVSYAKWYYGQNKHGWLFKPVQAFWMKIFNLLGEDVPFIRENGEVV